MLAKASDSFDAFRNSDYVLRLGESDGNLTAVDIDGTNVPHGDTRTPQQVENQMVVRELAEAKGPFAQNSVRPIEMAWREKTWRAMAQLGFDRPFPLWGFNPQTKQRVWASPDMLDQCAHILEPHVFHGVGTDTWVRHGSLYVKDGPVLGSWRGATEGLLHNMASMKKLKLSGFTGEEDPYNKGVKVARPPGRITLRYKDVDGVQWVQDFKRVFAIFQNQLGHPAARRVVLSEEHYPERDEFQIHLMPPWTTKQAGFDRMVLAPCALKDVSTDHVTALTSGDSKTDWDWMLFAGYDAKVIAFFVGGSNFTEYLVGDKRGKLYAGESVEWLAQKLRPEGRKGYYLFKPSQTQPDRLVVFGDQVFKDKQNVASLRAFMELKSQW